MHKWSPYNPISEATITDCSGCLQKYQLANCNFLLQKMVSEISLFTTDVFSDLTILEKRGRSFPPVLKHVRPTCSQLRRLLLNFWTKHVRLSFSSQLDIFKSKISISKY